VCGLTTGPSREEPARNLPEIVRRLSAAEDLDGPTRAGLLGRLAAMLAGSARLAGVRAVTTGRWLADVVLEVAPQVPVRSAAVLRQQHPALADDDIAELLVAAASKATAAVGAAGGALAAVEFAVPPTLLTAPVQLAAETVAVVAVELKLVAELHEIYGQAAAGTATDRTMRYAAAWAARRGVDPLSDEGIGGVLGGAARRQLRQRLVRRAGRNATTFAPFFAGALAGAELNRRDTRNLGQKMIEDLRQRRTGWYRP